MNGAEGVVAWGGFGPDSLFDLAAQLFQSWTLWTAVIILAEVLAIISLVRVIMTARTAAGAWAWALALISFPFVAVPALWTVKGVSIPAGADSEAVTRSLPLSSSISLPGQVVASRSVGTGSSLVIVTVKVSSNPYRPESVSGLCPN